MELDHIADGRCLTLEQLHVIAQTITAFVVRSQDSHEVDHSRFRMDGTSRALRHLRLRCGGCLCLFSGQRERVVFGMDVNIRNFVHSRTNKIYLNPKVVTLNIRQQAVQGLHPKSRQRSSTPRTNVWHTTRRYEYVNRVTLVLVKG